MNGPLRSLILAAGASRRLGQPKALVTLDGQQTLLARCINTSRAAGFEPLVAIAAGDDLVAAEARRAAAQIVEVADAAAGMSASIRAGIGRLEATEPAPPAVLILLADQWRIEPADLQALRATWDADPGVIAAARYEGQVGVPAIFPRDCFAILAGLSGDRGARDYLRSGGAKVSAVEMPGAGQDLDGPADLRRGGA